MSKYKVRNLHSMARSYINGNGQKISFSSGETKTLRSRPPQDRSYWSVEIIEQTQDDVETKKPVENNDDNGGDN